MWRFWRLRPSFSARRRAILHTVPSSCTRSLPGCGYSHLDVRVQGILPYFTETAANGSTAGWFGHSFGGMLTAMASGYALQPDSELLTKLMGLGNALVLPNIVMAAMDKGKAFDQKFPGTNINIWALQVPIHMALTTVTLMTAFGGSDKGETHHATFVTRQPATPSPPSLLLRRGELLMVLPLRL